MSSGLDIDDEEAQLLTTTSYQPLPAGDGTTAQHQRPERWTSGICAWFGDIQSCCIGLWCPSILFGRNVELLEDRPCMVPCMMHLLLCGVAAGFCCCGSSVPALAVGASAGSCVSFYACGLRKALRQKYNLEDAPCDDFVTHCFCHPCALCQEYRELKEHLSSSSNSSSTALAPPGLQTMSSSLP